MAMVHTRRRIGNRRDNDNDVGGHFVNRMPRTRKRTTTRAEKDVGVYEQAYEDITTGLLSLRAAAKKYDLCHVSLSRYKKKREEAGENSVAMGYRAWNKVFTDEHEKIMADYIIRASQIYYGLSPKEIKRLAYDLAKKYNLNILMNTKK
ncbi:CENP-B N-terminal DNA-binding domain [Popillia japonica]|uniref:CENP-B N-terminal DNA-binding domain n=1 Tax=Popillia japonica TaxID=7064 RepID=A0AAW1I965_POPJA